MDIADIPNLPSREERFEAITVDCYNEYEQLSAFEVYLTDALRTPFPALWGAPGTERLPVTVLGAADGSDDDGVLLRYGWPTATSRRCSPTSSTPSRRLE